MNKQIEIYTKSWVFFFGFYEGETGLFKIESTIAHFRLENARRRVRQMSVDRTVTARMAMFDVTGADKGFPDKMFNKSLVWK